MRHGPMRRMCGGYIVDRVASDQRRARLWRGLEIAVVTLGAVALMIFGLSHVLPVLP